MLSESDKKKLAEIEKALVESDPKIKDKLNPIKKRSEKLFLHIVQAAFGMIVIFTGLLQKFEPLSILGFIIALIGLNNAIKTLSRLKEEKFIL